MVMKHHLTQQLRMAIWHRRQLDAHQRRLGLAILVAAERIDATAEIPTRSRCR